ncbi:hypothetical protein niasHT_030868 [Heterodera trifolii]|uniref:Septin-type G domain-containing protein n=1 Tax=Heterodera trifolii TaxID=157864 RepID=A0ABD2HQT1_9BILA
MSSGATLTEMQRAPHNVHSLRSGTFDGSSGVGSISYIGFSNFPNQVFRRCIKDGFSFTLMVVGQTGLGKSTFLNTLFMAELHDQRQNDWEQQQKHITSTVHIDQKTMRLVENDVRLELTVVDTPGFGDQVNNANCWEPIIKYIDDRFAEYLTEETKIERKAHIPDKRVHLCLYFIAPTGHGLKQLDLAFLRALQDRVNIVPVIAKADTLTPAEMERFKQNIMNDIRKHDIQLYEFPGMEPMVLNRQLIQQKITAENGIGGAGTDKQNGSGVGAVHSATATVTVKKALSPSERLLPFAVVGSTRVKEVTATTGAIGGGGERKHAQLIRVREYPWGTVEVDNLAHNDFITLRDMIIRKHLIDLIDITRNVHYENYRMRNLPKNSFDGDDPFTRLEQEMRHKENELQDELKHHEQIFKQKVDQRSLQQMQRAQAMDAEERENKKVLEEKKALLDKLKQEVAELKRGNNMSVSSLDSASRSFASGSSPEKVHPSEQQRIKKLGHRLFGNSGRSGAAV